MERFTLRTRPAGKPGKDTLHLLGSDVRHGGGEELEVSVTEDKGEGQGSGIEEEDDSSGILKHKSPVMYSPDRAMKIKLPNNMESYHT